jgi:hypothetical protein
MELHTALAAKVGYNRGMKISHSHVILFFLVAFIALMVWFVVFQSPDAIGRHASIAVVS